MSSLVQTMPRRWPYRLVKIALLLDRSSVYEFQKEAYTLNNRICHLPIFGDAQPPVLGDRLALLRYWPDASLNLLRRLHEYVMSRNGAALIVANLNLLPKEQL